jgi:hypothetical protein
MEVILNLDEHRRICVPLLISIYIYDTPKDTEVGND